MYVCVYVYIYLRSFQDLLVDEAILRGGPSRCCCCSSSLALSPLARHTLTHTENTLNYNTLLLLDLFGSNDERRGPGPLLLLSAPPAVAARPRAKHLLLASQE